ncbi:MAG TPA: aminotransferase class V-fold PLP-dependent enzyme [Gaiellaceae bacterium]|nr:aminotransferase class V-fold PLP-dependent enzyme [Gaiellaceae bacterium]
MRTAERLRTDFLLDPAIAHLNHGAFGATPRPVLERQRELRDELERDPIEFLGRRLPERLADVRSALAAYLGVEEPGRLVLAANSTTALNAVASSLALGTGDEIVVTDREYGAMRLLWEEIARRTGATLVPAALPMPAVETSQLADAVWSAVTPRTRVLFFSHVTSETAIVLPAGELCRRARAAGILCVVDGAHGPGQLPLDLDDLGADAYAGNGHKWLCAPKGSAFLYARDELHEALRPTVVSWGWREGLQDRFGWSGTDDPTAVLALPAAIEYQEAHDWPAVRERCAALARETQRELVERVGAEPAAKDELQAPQMVAFAIPHEDPEGLQRALRERHRVEIPVREVDGRTIVRLSVQGYTSESDCARLVDALASEVT